MKSVGSQPATTMPAKPPYSPNGASGGVETRPAGEVRLHASCTALHGGNWGPDLVEQVASSRDVGFEGRAQWVVYWGDSDTGGREILCASTKEEAERRVRNDLPPGTPVYVYPFGSISKS